MTQAELAQRIHSSQPRIAKAEGGDRSVSLDLLMRAMLATGATPKEIGTAIAGAEIPA
jgi:transcriptional regulator with XRE-family HTH domain